MTSAPTSTPALASTSDGAFPHPSRFDSLREEISDLSAAWRRIDCSEYLESWCGTMPETVPARLGQVNHLGLYIGDYRDTHEVLAWDEFLRSQVEAGGVEEVELGPSYISPRQYGTQGWWNTYSIPTVGPVETFSCLHHGPWSERSSDERRRLMSHVAVDVHDLADVRAVLDAFERESDAVEVIAYTELDDHGHTYGHLRNNTTRTVVEIVHQSPRDR